MHPKHELEKLNRRRERERRLRFINRRIGEIFHEYRLADGRASTLPATIAEPPIWALNSAKEFLRLTFKRPSDDEVAKNPLRAFGEVKGMIDVMGAAMAEAATDDDPTTKRFAAKMLRLAQAQPEVAKTSAKSAARAEALASTSAKGRLEYNRSQLRGAERVTTEDGEIRVLRTAQAEIFYVVWFFWPELSGKLSELTSGKLHRWLTHSLGIHTSEKTVELVYTRLRLGAFVRAASAT